MSRNPQIEAIHEARYDLETCAPAQKTELRRNWTNLLRKRRLDLPQDPLAAKCWISFTMITRSSAG